MAILHSLAKETFSAHGRNSEETDLAIALDQIDNRTWEAGRMILTAQRMVIEADGVGNIEEIGAVLTGCLATLCTIAEPFDAVRAEINKLRKTAATHAAMTVGTPIA